MRKQKDNVLTAGKWTDEGLERYNNLLVNIREARQHRGNFEIELTGQYVLNEPRDVYLNTQHKRKNDSNNGQSTKKEKSTGDECIECGRIVK